MQILILRVCLTIIALSFLQVALPQPANYDKNWRYRWVEEEWKGDDSKFQQVRNTLDSQFEEIKASNSKTPIADIARHFRELADKYENQLRNPKDKHLAQFKFAYALYLAAAGDNKLLYSDRYQRANEGFYKLPSPHSYEYARLRYLMDSKSPNWNARKFAEERLLKHDPDDFRVRAAVAMSYDPNVSLKYREKTLSIVEQLVKDHEDQAYAHIIYAQMYYLCWRDTRSTEHKSKAVNGYKQFLKMALPDDPARDKAQWALKDITSGESRR